MRFVAPALTVFLSWLSVLPDSPRSKPVSFAILEDYDKGEDLAEIERDFALFDELDIHTWRGSLAWDDYEPQHTTIDLDWLHRFAEA
ncbi:MAG TPA: hypothetical protein VK886_12615 [Vicinamibacterales bacterium]|nr:hypothetical protein [Vicinamibacterales bacterium]